MTLDDIKQAGYKLRLYSRIRGPRGAKVRLLLSRLGILHIAWSFDEVHFTRPSALR